jgi:hypothetical protein
MAVLYNMAMLHPEIRSVNNPVGNRNNSGFGRLDISPESPGQDVAGEIRPMNRATSFSSLITEGSLRICSGTVRLDRRPPSSLRSAAADSGTVSKVEP